MLSIFILPVEDKKFSGHHGEEKTRVGFVSEGSRVHFGMGALNI
jgi:hypothetical protein